MVSESEIPEIREFLCKNAALQKSNLAYNLPEQIGKSFF